MRAKTKPRTKLCNPEGAPDLPPRKLAARLKSLRGARVAFIDNGKEFSGQVIGAVAEVMQREYGVEAKFWDKGFPSKAAPFIAELAASCDAVVTGVGH
jgi:hypothetical protein